MFLYAFRDSNEPTDEEWEYLRGLTRDAFGAFRSALFSQNDLDKFVKNFVLQPRALLLGNHDVRDSLPDGFVLQAPEAPIQLETPNKEALLVVSDGRQNLIDSLKRDAELVHKISPRQFEELCFELLLNLGWDAELTPSSRDGGFDIVASVPTPFGQPVRIAVECKQYDPKRPVNVQIVRSFYGAITSDGSFGAGAMISTSGFTRDARLFETKHLHFIFLRDLTWVTENLGKLQGPQ